MAKDYAIAAGFLLGLAENGISDTDLACFAENPALMIELSTVMHALRARDIHERQQAHRYYLSDANADIALLGLGVPFTQKLRNDGFRTVSWLTKASAAGLAQKGYKKRQIDWIVNALRRYGLKLNASPQAIFPSPEAPRGRA